MRATRLTSARRPAFTLVELLVVIAVITILAGITMPVILKGFRISQVAGCLSNIGQVMKGISTYSTAWDTQLPCGGTTWWPASINQNQYYWTSTLSPNQGCEQPDEPWLSGEVVIPADMRAAKTWKVGKKDEIADRHAYWYEACISYINAGVSDAKARDSLEQKGNDSPSRDEVREEMQRLAGVLTCPAKKQAAMGYGYHYTAPHGVDMVYPCWPKTDASGNKIPRQQVDIHYNGFKWAQAPYTTQDFATVPVDWYNYPVNFSMDRTPVPVLWYNMTLSNSVITNPSAQIALCDTGLITNDPDLEKDALDWEESPDSNVSGYVRFPLCDWYKGETDENIKYYKTPPEDDPDTKNRAWRPVPRHSGKTVSAMFDGSARSIPIHEIVDYEWGDGKCLFDNKPSYRAPIPPKIIE